MRRHANHYGPVAREMKPKAQPQPEQAKSQAPAVEKKVQGPKQFHESAKTKE